MKNCTEYWKKRAELAEKIMDENQIGAWKKWKDFKTTPVIHRTDIDGNCLDCKEKVIK